jgi:hypothetical protein
LDSAPAGSDALDAVVTDVRGLWAREILQRLLGGETDARALVEVAIVAGRTKGTYLSTQFCRIAARRGKGRAVVAVGRSVLVAMYHMRTRRETYRELGAQYFDERERDKVQRRLVYRLERLGFAVILEALPAPSRRFSGGCHVTRYTTSDHIASRC